VPVAKIALYIIQRQWRKRPMTRKMAILLVHSGEKRPVPLTCTESSYQITQDIYTFKHTEKHFAFNIFLTIKR